MEQLDCIFFISLTSSVEPKWGSITKEKKHTHTATSDGLHRLDGSVCMEEKLK